MLVVEITSHDRKEAWRARAWAQLRRCRTRSAPLLPLVAAGAILQSVAAGVAAQTVPLPTLPAPEKAPASEPPSPTLPRATEPQAVSPESAVPRPWEYALGVGVAWNRNVAFARPDGLDSTAVLPSAALARVLSGPRGQLRVSTAGRWNGYPSQDVFSRFYFDAGLQGDYRVSTQARLRADVRCELGYSDSSPTLIEQGVPLPLVKTRSLNGELDLTRQLGPRTSLGIAGRVSRTDFEAPGLVDASSLRATASLGRALAARDSTAVVYSVEAVLSSDPQSHSYLTHFGSLQWTHTLTARSAALLEAGASYTPEASSVGLGQNAGFYGGVTFLHQIGRSSLTAYLRREVAPAFGLGVSRLEDRAGVQGEVPMGLRWRLRVDAYHTRPHVPEGAEPADPSYSSNSDVHAALARLLGRRFALSGDARYRRRWADATRPPVSALEAGLYVTFGSFQR